MSVKNAEIIVKVDPELREIISPFLENKQKEIKELRAALEQHDFDRIYMVGHKLKGSGTSYGFPAISDWGLEIETAGKEKNIQRVSSAFLQLIDYLARVKVIYEEEG